MSLIGHNLSLGLEQGSIDLVSASRNTVLHSCRFWLNEPVSPNLLLHVYSLLRKIAKYTSWTIYLCWLQ